MSISGDNSVVILAGASGLVGTEVLKLVLEEDPITQVYALTRQELPFFHSKLEQIKDTELRVLEWNETKSVPEIGLICLGTTLKQAGSKEKLEQVDYQLVCDVAQSMKVLGVKKLAVVSSIGASPYSLSHYLKCKGRMEETIRKMGFEKLVFARPGPLSGLREEPRKNEMVTEYLLKLLTPFMIGPLAKYIPIKANNVAKAMLFELFDQSSNVHKTLNSTEMRRLISRYQ
ncbi:NAD(P)H-binding protein [uncultured Vibrio sp.]|uniref:NAD(P)H-binding protein n=1 Tax=uncultured Vibrio sp. TaxID=114054 RepID=UPI00091DAF20|nr:NAD(P)H-binding protein [uncultured Vibrio sp.]OIQ26274.1 MAG: nucleoside-diphosphate sugar epimerase [Vibrio sp. MedPE-SWchi]